MALLSWVPVKTPGKVRFHDIEIGIPGASHTLVGAISAWRQVLAGARLVKWPPMPQCRRQKAGHLVDVGEEGSNGQEEGIVGR